MASTRLQLTFLFGFFHVPRFLRTAFLMCFLLSSVSMLAVLVAVFTIQPLVPIFYSLALPTQHLAAKEWLFLFPVISFVIAFLHLSIVNSFRGYNQLIIELFAWMTVGIETILLLALLRILWIVS